MPVSFLSRIRCFILPLSAAWLGWQGGADAAEILSYHARLQPDMAMHSIQGQTRIALRGTAQAASQLSFPVHALNVTALELDGSSIPVNIAQGKLLVPLPASPPGQTHSLQISYQGKPDQGLVFGTDYVYTAFHTCHWMICDEAPGIRASVDMEIQLPADYKLVASGVPVAIKSGPDGLVSHLWHQQRADASYLYGFAAGKFQQTTERVGEVTLDYYGAVDDAAALRKKFQPTSQMLEFLQQKAGVPFPHPTYSQVLLPGSEAQELSSFSVIGKQMLDPILDEPREDWVIVHELAHQWWGNSLTCRDWKDFWLNEGITVFMVAAYKEQRWGHAAYVHELELASKRWQAAIDAGFDKPLAYVGDYPSLRIQRAITYSKGAIFMDVLRKELGDELFWQGFRHYTQQYAGKSVDSRDFQLAMEQTAGRPLGTLFDAWVNGK